MAHFETSKYSFFNICQITLLCFTSFIQDVAAQQSNFLVKSNLRFPLSDSSKTRLSNYHVKSNLSWIGPLLTSRTGNRFVLDIDVTFAPEMCCPRFVFLTDDTIDNSLIKDGCYNVSSDVIRTLLLAKLAGERHMEIDQTDLSENPPPNSDCKQSKSTGMYTCELVLYQYLYTPKNASVYAYHPCFDRKSMDFKVHISLWTDTISYPCKTLKTTSTCYRLYQEMYLPNVFGNIINEDADTVLAVANMLDKTKCHKHIEPFLCRTFFPECTINGVISPCRSMCLELLQACSVLIQYFLSAFLPQIKDQYFAIEYLCKLFPEDGLCYAENVTCESPGPIDHGILNLRLANVIPVHSTATYECEEGHELEGNSTVVCEYSGEWSTHPQCIPISNKRQMIILGAAFGTFAGVTLIVILVVLIFRREIVVLLYAKFGIRFSKHSEEERKFDAFIAYSQEDIGFVKHQLLRPLEKMKPRFKICIHHRDFEIGDFITTNIINAIKQSRRTIIVLSQSFIDSEWCKFEFEQAHLQLLNDKSYKLLVVALDQPKNLHNIPQLIQSYILTRTYLMRTDKLFWQKLLYQMPEKKVNQAEDGNLYEVQELPTNVNKK